MIPGFAYMYKDSDDFIHLFFYHGLDNSNNKIYNDIDLSENFKYEFEVFGDNSIDFKFYDKNIIKIICKYIKLNNEEVIEELEIYK